MKVILCLLVATAGLVGAGQNCDLLEKKLAANYSGIVKPRNAIVKGQPLPLVVKWDGRGAARAAAALFASLLARGMRYTHVKLQLERPSPEPLDHTLRSGDSIYYSKYTFVEMWPAAAVTMLSTVRDTSCLEDVFCWMKLGVLGPGAAPATLTLLVHQAEDVNAAECQGAKSWPFFKNKTMLGRCGFLRLDSNATVYYLSDRIDIAEELKRRAEAYGLFWKLTALGEDAKPRRQLRRLLQEGNQSFLFVDQEVWISPPRVFTSQPPPCLSNSCQSTLDPVYTTRLAHWFALDNFMSIVYNVFIKFDPTPEEIRQILEEEADLGDSVEVSEEAACTWSVKNINRFKSWFEKDMVPNYWIVVLLCDPDIDEYDDFIHQVHEDIAGRVKFKFKFQTYAQNCSNSYNMGHVLSEIQKYKRFGTLLGLVGSGEGARNAAAEAKKLDTALVLFDSVFDNHTLTEAARGVGGTASQLAAAVARLVTGCGWARLAVLSDSLSLAKGIYDALLNTNLVPRNALLQTPSKVKEHLERFREENARIFFVNTDADTAVAVLCEAMTLGMTPSEGYVWLVREWRARKYNCKGIEVNPAAMRHYTVSFGWRGPAAEGNVSDADIDWIIRKRLGRKWPGVLPQNAASLADALLLLVHAADAFLINNWSNSTFLHDNGAAKALWDAATTPVAGVTRKLYTHTAPDPIVYVDEWRGDRESPRSVGVWRLDGDDAFTRSGEICGGGDISDGGKKCITERWYGPGDRFTWRCHDWLFLLTTLALTLALLALILARRARLAWLKRTERMLKAQMAAREVRAAHELGSQLVDRALLELRHELGAGRFGRVRLAVLRAPDRPPIAVAAKALPDDATPAEEREFLREACTMSSLQHSHIVRLVGVCASGGPPLVLMEYAFFGDLCAYLRSRRHLAEHIEVDIEEAQHVSAESLTRLASEAASALAYLASKRLVHRDVRAANCLVDARRSLKLADFGMARQTAPSAEYWCQRRGFFPVLWMAPESLERGVFSAASDIWALGVLMYELVTLGGRPYGEWPPGRVMRFVVGGGHPPLPPDASDTTRNVLLSCWRRSAVSRAPARALCAYLRARRSALAPALLPAPDPDVSPSRAPSVLSIDHFTEEDEP